MKKFTFLLFICVTIFLACDEEIPTKPIGTQPALTDIVLPETIYVSSTTTYLMSVRVEDPQGVSDISLVTVEISSAATQNVVQTDTLKDDGKNGDILPVDGVFSGILDPSFAAGNEGDYVFTFYAYDQAGNTISKSSDPVKIVDTVENRLPVISQPQVPEMVDVNAEGEYVISVVANDPDGLSDIKHLLCQIYDPRVPQTPNRVDTLNDAGKNGDTAPGDGIFATKITAAYARNRVGIYSFRFQAVDLAGGQSNPIVRTVSTINTDNLPPVISDLVAPDTLVLHPENVVITTMTVSVTDPQGLSDVEKVIFNSFLPPDERPSSGNPFFMSDDGNTQVSGDRIAGDGVYSLTINLPPTMSPGNYKFVFEAVDFSGEHSNQIPWIVTVRK